MWPVRAAECLRSLPCLFVADVGVAVVRMFLWRSSSWISRKSFPTWLRRIVAAEWRNPWAVISPTPSALQANRSRRLNARFENGAPE